MKVAVASLGTVPEAWVGVKFGLCSQFLVFDLDTLDYMVLSLPPRQERPEQVSLTAIRAIASQGVSAVITGSIKEVCRKTLLDLGIEVIDGVEGMTVREAVERYRVTGLRTEEERRGMPARIAVAAQGDSLDTPLTPLFDACASFIVVDPQTKAWELVRVEAGDMEADRVSLDGVRAVARSGVTALITSQIRPECCLALQALAIAVYRAPEGITAREAIERYESGSLEQLPAAPFVNL